MKNKGAVLTLCFVVASFIFLFLGYGIKASRDTDSLHNQVVEASDKEPTVDVEDVEQTAEARVEKQTVEAEVEESTAEEGDNKQTVEAEGKEQETEKNKDKRSEYVENSSFFKKQDDDYEFYVAFLGDRFFDKDQLKQLKEQKIYVENGCNMEKASEMHCDLYIAVHTGNEGVIFYDDSFYVPEFDSLDLATTLQEQFLSLAPQETATMPLKKSEIWKEVTCPAVELNCLEEDRERAMSACYETILELKSAREDS